MSRGKWKKRQEIAFPTTESTVVDAATAPVADIIESNEKNAKQKKEVKKSADAIPTIFTPQQVAFLFDVYAGVLSFVFATVLKADYKVIYEELSFDDSEKLAMAEPLATIASKYAPSAWAGMTAEIQLITTLGIWSVTSFKRAQTAVATERERKQKEKEKSAIHAAPQNTPKHSVLA